MRLQWMDCILRIIKAAKAADTKEVHTMKTWTVYQKGALEALELANRMELEGKENVRIFKDEEGYYGVSYTR